MEKNKKIGLISLGCDKNRVDSEKALALIGDRAVITNDINEANIVIINSCAFLEASRKESIDAVMEVNELRNNGVLEKIVLSGCLPQKFINELFDDLTEVDVFLGFLDYDLLFEALDKAYNGERVNYVNKKKIFAAKKRVLTTPCHYYYLKIADGCNNKCTYCLIPKIRGRYKSEKIEDLVDEVKLLGDAKEVILVAQDVTRYGVDLYGSPMLVPLIRELSKLSEVEKIRILYAYPDMISDELIGEIKNNDKVIKYIDIPLQHASDRVLKLMNRKGTNKEYLALIEKLRENVPDIAIRSTFITGFPGETEEDFKVLEDFIKTVKFTNCGFFAYSREPDTPAYKLPDQIDEGVKKARVKKLYGEQKKISAAFLKTLIGKTITVVTDGIDYDKQSFYGRAYYSAPDIDGKVYFSSESDIVQGETYKVYIEKTDDYDAYGRVAE